MRQVFIKYLSCLLALAAIAGCDKTAYQEVVSNVNVRLTSSGFYAEKVNITVSAVQANYSDTSWVNLPVNNQTLNLLDYQNNIDTSIAQGPLPATSILKKLRIIFNSRNSIQINGKMLPLVSAEPPVLIVDVNRKLNRNIEKVLLAIDPSKSITVNETGLYQFVPFAVLK